MSLTRGFISWLATQRAFTRAVGSTGMRLGFARRFIAGETLEEALTTAEALNRDGLRVIMNHLGENVRNADEAHAAYRSYHHILHELRRRGIDGNVTVKPTQLALEFDAELCRTLTLNLVREAAALRNVVEIDMEHSSTTEATIALFEQVRRECDNVGLAVQSYLFRTEEDVRRLKPLHPKIRLVKGAYLEPPDVAFGAKRDVDANYRTIMRLLFADGYFPAIATHDEALLEAAKAMAREFGRAADSWEVQMLLGIRRDLQERLARDGYGMRVYVTYGTEWVPYFMRRLAERPANVAFVVKSILKGR